MPPLSALRPALRTLFPCLLFACCDADWCLVGAGEADTENGSDSDSDTSDPTVDPMRCDMNGTCDPDEDPLTCPSDCPIPEGCGNGDPDDGEVCDDGADNGMYGKCQADCSGVAECGDGKVNGPEQCDDGADNGDDAACTAKCEQAVCGDGLVQAGVEACDDGNNVDGDACSNACELKNCGDGVLQEPEQCDDGNDVETDACTNLCAPATCGDGHTQTGVEECDLGPDNANDKACTEQCKNATCGDALVQAGVEDCDDGNPADDDACVLCKPAVCGDGHVWAGMEECDDGNDDETDLCTKACTPVIARQVFVSSVSFNGKFNTNAPTGLEGADGRCQGLAMVAGLSGTFKAWLSDSTTGPADRFDTAFTGVYKLIDGTPVAVGWTGLTDGPLLHAINVTELGAKNVDTIVWSNTTVKGEPLGTLHCSDWTSLAAQPKGALGYSSAMDSTWTDAMDASSCAALTALYCFEDPA